MKVIRIATSLNYGGIEKVFELHAKYHNRSYELVFVALGRGGSTQLLLQSMGYRVIVLNSKKVGIPSPKLIQQLFNVFKKEKPDVVHAAGAEANFHVPIAAKMAGVRRIICEEIGIPSHSEKAKILFRLIYKLSDRVIAISRAVKDYLISSKEVPADKAVLIYNPINEVTTSAEGPRVPLLFTVVARIEPVKNLILLVEAFSELLKKHPDARLNIIGDGSQRQLLEERIHALRIPQHVKLKGFIPDPYPELSKSTFFILPSLYEGFGLACIEAIETGNIVICTNSGGIPEFVTDGEQGFLFNPTSKEALLIAIENAIRLTEDERLRMVQSARRTVASMFSPRKYLMELKELYKVA